MPINPDAMRERFRRVAWNYRHLRGDYGLAVHSVSLLTTTYAGAVTGEGAKTETVTPIVEKTGLAPKVRLVKSDEIAVANLPQHTIDIGPITPELGAQILQLNAFALGVGGTRHLIVTGPDGVPTKHDIISINEDRAFHYTIRAAPVSVYVAPAAVTPPGPPATPDNVQVDTTTGSEQVDLTTGVVQVGLP